MEAKHDMKLRVEWPESVFETGTPITQAVAKAGNIFLRFANAQELTIPFFGDADVTATTNKMLDNFRRTKPKGTVLMKIIGAKVEFSLVGNQESVAPNTDADFIAAETKKNDEFMKQAFGNAEGDARRAAGTPAFAP